MHSKECGEEAGMFCEQHGESLTPWTLIRLRLTSRADLREFLSEYTFVELPICSGTSSLDPNSMSRSNSFLEALRVRGRCHQSQLQLNTTDIQGWQTFE